MPMKPPAPTSKILKSSGHVSMKDQMSHASVPHHVFQEVRTPGSRTPRIDDHSGQPIQMNSSNGPTGKTTPKARDFALKNGGFIKELGNIAKAGGKKAC